MSKRSGLSRLQDLKRGFVDIGRYRYILHKFDMETWKDQTCPICEKGFEKEPTYYMNYFAIHNDCADSPAFDLWIESFRGLDENEHYGN